jgi:hypothetical protein
LVSSGRVQSCVTKGKVRFVQQSVRLSTALPAVIGIPISITFFPPAAIPVIAIIIIGTGIVVWHLHHGGRAFVRRSPKGTLTFVLDSARKPTKLRRRK